MLHIDRWSPFDELWQMVEKPPVVSRTARYSAASRTGRHDVPDVNITCAL